MRPPRAWARSIGEVVDRDGGRHRGDQHHHHQNPGAHGHRCRDGSPQSIAHRSLPRSSQPHVSVDPHPPRPGQRVPWRLVTARRQRLHHCDGGGSGTQSDPRHGLKGHEGPGPRGRPGVWRGVHDQTRRTGGHHQRWAGAGGCAVGKLDGVPVINLHGTPGYASAVTPTRRCTPRLDDLADVRPSGVRWQRSSARATRRRRRGRRRLGRRCSGLRAFRGGRGSRRPPQHWPAQPCSATECSRHLPWTPSLPTKRSVRLAERPGSSERQGGHSLLRLARRRWSIPGRRGGGQDAHRRADVFDLDEDLHDLGSGGLVPGRGAARVPEMVAEAIRQGPMGWVDDDLAILSPWGFDVGDIRRAGDAGRRN